MTPDDTFPSYNPRSGALGCGTAVWGLPDYGGPLLKDHKPTPLGMTNMTHEDYSWDYLEMTKMYEV